MSKFPDFIMKIFINLENIWELARASWEEIFLEPVLWQKKCSKFRKIWEKNSPITKLEESEQNQLRIHMSN